MTQPRPIMDNIRVPDPADQVAVLDEWETIQSLLNEVAELKAERDRWRQGFVELDAAMNRLLMESRLLYRQTRFMLAAIGIVAGLALLLVCWGG